MNCNEICEKMSKELLNGVCKTGYITKAKALVDTGNGVENECDVVDVVYNPHTNTLILYIDGREII